MRNHPSLYERVREHEVMAEKFHQVEVRLLATLDFRTFFQALMEEIQQAFDIPHVWFSLIQGTEIFELMVQADAFSGLGERLVRVSSDRFHALLGDEERPLLVNQDLSRYQALFSAQHTHGIGSLSLIPIRVDGVLVGSLNQADSDTDRYAPGLSTIFLERLATKLALGLSNVAAHEKLRFQAHHDPLTQLLNRRVMETILERELHRAERYGSHLSVAFIDLDAFKQVNDSHGHDVGDKLLQYVAQGMSRMVRNSDVVTRYAGDEFVVVLPETSAENACRLMERIQQTFLQHPLKLDQLTLPVRLSAGVASAPAPEIRSMHDLLREADQQLYRNKRDNRQRHGKTSLSRLTPAGDPHGM